MLGSLAEAEDAVQEAHLRRHPHRPDEGGGCARVPSKTVTRLSLDQLKSARARREIAEIYIVRNPDKLRHVRA